MGRYDRTPEQRFFEKVDQPAYSAACWTWTASRCSEGYGNFFHEGRIQGAHRVSWMLFRGGEIPEGLCICHTCDNPSCVNPDHLWLGSKLDNNLDKVRKGRHAWGVKTHCIRNHPLSGDNLHLSVKGLRECRECRRIMGRVYDAARRARKRKGVA